MAFGRVAVTNRVARSGRVAVSLRAQEPATILGSRLVGLYEADACIVSGGLATTILDKSGTGNISTSAAGMTWNASSASFRNYPSWTFNGTTSTFGVSTFLLGKPASAIFAFAVIKFAAFLNAATIVGFTGQFQLREFSGGRNSPQMVSGGNSFLSPSVLAVNTPMTVYGWVTEPVGSLQTFVLNNANIGDSIAATGPPSAVMTASGTMQFGAAAGGGSLFIQGEATCFLVGAGIPSPRESAALIRWAQRKYGVAG